MTRDPHAPVESAPPVIGAAPLRYRLAVLWRQCELFSRYLRFHWRVLQPAGVTPQGFKLYGNRHMLAGTFEPLETRVVSRLLQSSDIVVNVGANIGYYCCLAAQAGKRVIAFEPVDLNVRHLLANLLANNWADQVEIFPVALGPAPGILSLYGGGTGASLVRGWAHSPDSHANLTPINTLDATLGDRLTGRRPLMIVDIEGAEYIMLQGAARTLAATPRPTWLLEVNITQHQPSGVALNPRLGETFDLFWNQGYEAWAVLPTPRLVDHDEIAAIRAGGPDTLGTISFVFAAEGTGARLLLD